MGTGVKHSPHPDGRVERWREHRIERRSQLVDATLVALEEHGPEVNLSQIAAIAGIPKPKIYRHFDDKADLVSAVGERFRDQILVALASTLLPDITVGTHVRNALRAVLDVIAVHPNAVKMLMNSPPPKGRPNAITEGGRFVAEILIAFTAEDFSKANLSPKGAEPLAHALVGSVIGAADWWLLQPEDERMSIEELTEHLAVVLIGAGDAALRTIGLALDPEAIIGAEHLVHLTPQGV